MPQFDRLGNDMSDDIQDALAWEREHRGHRTDCNGDGIGDCWCFEDSEDYQAHELTGYEEHLRDSEGCGDARRCPRHPGVKTSSDDGMFDAPCDRCEAEMYEAEQKEAYEAWEATQPKCASAFAMCDTTHQPFGFDLTYCPKQSAAVCDTDSIPF